MRLLRTIFISWYLYANAWTWEINKPGPDAEQTASRPERYTYMRTNNVQSREDDQAQKKRKNKK